MFKLLRQRACVLVITYIHYIEKINDWRKICKYFFQFILVVRS
jgi:hypothetical protein